MVKPMTASLTPNDWATNVADSTNTFEPTTKQANPNRMSRMAVRSE